MSRLFAYMGNDQDRVKCALYPARKSLVADGAAKDSFDAWGLGFYQGGEVLLQRRPKPPTEPVDFYALVKDLRTDMIIGHVRQGTVGKPRTRTRTRSASAAGSSHTTARSPTSTAYATICYARSPTSCAATSAARPTPSTCSTSCSRSCTTPESSTT